MFVEWIGPDENIVTKLEPSGRSKTLATLTRHQHYFPEDSFSEDSFSEDSKTTRVARSEAERMASVRLSAKTKTGPSKRLCFLSSVFLSFVFPRGWCCVCGLVCCRCVG